MTEIQPREIGNYAITGVIGEGGMGRVYEGKHTILGRIAAIKVLWPEHVQDDELARRFVNEARAATNIHHPGIVDIYDLGYQDDGSVFIAMERLRGENLAERMRRMGKLSPVRAALFASQICSALQAAHAAGIVHRDLKPSNIYIVPDSGVPGGERIKLLDFGIAKFSVPGEAGAVATRSGAMMGTPQYMSPEQCTDSSKVDHRADVYSLGCILFEMLCNRPPFRGPSYIEIVSAQINDVPPAPSSLQPGIQPELDAIVARAMTKERHERFASAGEFGAALQAAMGNSFPTMDMPEGAVAVPWEPLWRWQSVKAIGGLLVLGSLAAGAWHYWERLGLGELDSGRVVALDAGPVVDAVPEPVLQEEAKWTQLAEGVTSIPGAKPGQTTWLLRTSPPGAKVFLDGEQIGHTGTPLLGRVAAEPEQQVVLELELPGYWADPLVLSSLSDHRDEIIFGPAVSVKLLSIPSGATVIDPDGTEMGKTPMKLEYRQGGRRSFTLRLEGYSEVIEEIEFRRPHTEQVPLPRLMVVNIDSDPPGAQVWLEDTMLGVTPYSGELPEQKNRRVFDLDYPRCERKTLKLSGRREENRFVRLTCQ